MFFCIFSTCCWCIVFLIDFITVVRTCDHINYCEYHNVAIVFTIN